jgi:hypothetical protein
MLFYDNLFILKYYKYGDTFNWLEILNTQK